MGPFDGTTMCEGETMRQTLLLCGMLLAGLVMTSAKSWGQSGITDQSRRGVTCASDDGKRHYCAVDTSRGVQLQKQRSGSPCVQGQTWGYDRRGVWVDRGCRAEFALGGRGGGSPGYGQGPGNGGGGNWNGPGGGGGRQTVTCSSNNNSRVRCDADTSRGVQMVNQRSGSPCVQGQTWGYDRRGIWVDRGCRADFALGRGR